MQQTGTQSPVSSLKAEIHKIRSLPKGKRWEYIWEYYRLAIFLIGFAVFFIWMIGTFLGNMIMNTLFPKEPVSIAFAAPGFSNCQEWMDGCMNAIGYNDQEENLQVMATSPISNGVDDFRINTSVWLANGQPDIFVVDENTYQYLLSYGGILAELSVSWPQELQQLAADYRADAYSLEISDTPFAQAYGIGEEPAYLCMYIHGNGFDRALDIVEYILNEN